MEKRPRSNALAIVVTAIVTALLVMVTTGLLVYFWQQNVCLKKNANSSASSSNLSETDSDSLSSASTMPVTLNATEATTRTMTYPGDAPVDMTEQFLLYTLGTLPGAEINYTKAKELASKNLRAQWTSDDFIPLFYGIQEGPDTFDVISQTTIGDESVVLVDVKWGEMMLRWSFTLIYEDNSWKVDSFRNDAQ